MRHVLEAQQFDLESLATLFGFADHLERHAEPLLEGRILASLFYEPSTRTRFSFESAMLRLGGNILSTENAREFSSAAKGETLEDSIRVIGNYADVIVLRHYEEGAAARAAAVSSIPIVNAGDGAGQHPTQALLDLYTIKRELGSIEGRHIALVGDLAHGRTVRSLSYLLAKYPDVRLSFVSPPELSMRSDIREYLDRHRTPWIEGVPLDTALAEADVVYVTRLQKERFADDTLYERVSGRYRIDVENASRMKAGSILMHPLPRIDEIALGVDVLPQAAYFRQAQYGLLVRMALLASLFA
jgi:aspartate carbamoyltransferase catalytic subunit